MNVIPSRLTPVLGRCALAVLPWLVGCGGHEARTLRMRTALDVGNPKAAIASLNEELGVNGDRELPRPLEGDAALLVLDRGSIQQSLVQFDASKRDFEAADKAIDMLDLSRTSADSIGEYVFSGSSGRYQAPPYEKLMINTLNMVNYLEQRDLNGARVEARRLSVMQRYYRDKLEQKNNPVLGLGGLLAGFVFEKSGDTDEALRYYDEALSFGVSPALKEAVARIGPYGSYRSPRIRAILDEGGSASTDSDEGDVLFVVGFGRVPHKVPVRMPIGLALTMFADSLSPADREGANKLALQGLVTWINYPTLAPGQGDYAVPSVRVDGKPVVLEDALDVEREVRREWKGLEGKIICSAITRMVARLVVGKGVELALGQKDKGLGLLGSLVAQATLAAVDTPDTRSWETLPARISAARIRLPAGKRRVSLEVRGYKRSQELTVEKGGWNVVSLMALR